jgi:LysM repeat protein
MFGLQTSLWGNIEVQLKYIDDFKSLAIKEMERTGIPASIKLAQGLLESDAGRSYLAQKANNHFGIKCGDDWDGGKIYKQDDDYNDKGKLISSCFRKYDHAKYSWVAHSEFLKRNRYRPLFFLESTDYKSWARKLQELGYATSLTYAGRLIEIIERYDLQTYDKVNIVAPDFSNKTMPPTTSREPYRTTYVNHIKITYSSKGETWEDISERTKIPLQTLLKYNDILSEATKILPEDTGVFLQPKRSSFMGKTTKHKVIIGETMYDISQHYGIQLMSLYERNVMKVGTEPAPDEEIWLKSKRTTSPKLRQSEIPKSNTIQKTEIVTDEDNDGNIDMEEELFLEELELPKYEPKKPTTPIQETRKEPTMADNIPNDVYYEVKAKDTLFSISKKHNITLEQLRSWNNLLDNYIKAGQLLRVK